MAEIDEAKTVDVSYEWLDDSQQADFAPPRDTQAVILTGNKLKAVPATLLDPLGHGLYGALAPRLAVAAMLAASGARARRRVAGGIATDSPPFLACGTLE